MSKKYENVMQFKIALLDIKPQIWRRIQVPENYSFWDLHCAIQDAMGWWDSHLHEFTDEKPYSRKRPNVIEYSDAYLAVCVRKMSHPSDLN